MEAVLKFEAEESLKIGEKRQYKGKMLLCNPSTLETVKRLTYKLSHLDYVSKDYKTRQ